MTSTINAVQALQQLLAQDEALREQLAMVSSIEAAADLLAAAAQRHTIAITRDEILEQLTTAQAEGHELGDEELGAMAGGTFWHWPRTQVQLK